MSQPTSPHMSRYRQSADTDDGRLIAPTFARNSPPMIATLAPWLSGRTGNFLELGAGTGQHAAAFGLAFPALNWYPSDPDTQHRASCAAWASFLRAPEHSAIDIDASTNWAEQVEVKAIAPLSGILSMNVIHIAPISVLHGIIAGASQTLAKGGILIFYGPFKEHGRHTGPGNRNFDAGLRAENPDWGVRDIDDVDQVANEVGLTRAALIAMPANNRLLIYRR